MKKTLFCIVILILFILLLGSKGWAQRVEFTTLDYRYTIFDPGFQHRVIKSKADWERLQREYYLSPRGDACKLPLQVDFSKEMVIVVSWGDKPRSTYEIEIKDIELKGDKIVVYAEKRYPEAPGETEKLYYPSHTVNFPKLYHLKGDKDVDVLKMCEEYMEDPDVEYAEPNWIIEGFATPNDPWFGHQWGLSKIEAPKAWDLETGKEDVLIAILDTGVDYNHEDLMANMWENLPEKNGLPGVDDDGNAYIDDIRGWNFVDDNNDPRDISIDSHGTSVAGVAAAITNNNAGISGVAGGWAPDQAGCKIMPLKMMTGAEL